MLNLCYSLKLLKQRTSSLYLGHFASMKHQKSSVSGQELRSNNTWNSKRKRLVDFCLNLTIDQLTTNWYYNNRYICNCSGHLCCLIITLKIFKWCIGTASKCIFLHVNIKVMVCIFFAFIIFMVYYAIQQYNRTIYSCNTLFFYPKYLKTCSKYQLDQVISTHLLNDWFFYVWIFLLALFQLNLVKEI